MKTTAAAKKTRTLHPFAMCVKQKHRLTARSPGRAAAVGRAGRVCVSRWSATVARMRGWCPIVWCRRVCDDRVIPRYPLASTKQPYMHLTLEGPLHAPLNPE